jgi:hypothetical protein
MGSTIDFVGISTNSIAILKKLVYYAAIITITIGLTAGNSLADSTKVIDIEGNAYNVTDLEAVYEASGSWTGGRVPTDQMKSLSIFISYGEGFITITEKLDLPFSSMRQIDFQDDGSSVLIQMGNGTQVFINDTFFEEKNSSGNSERTIQLIESRFSSRVVQGANVRLRGFGGRAKTKSGIEGDIYIPLVDISRIEFLWSPK